MKLTRTTVVLTLAFIWIVATLVVGQYLKAERLHDEAGTIPPLSITCQEDMACWDCTTMGNHRCGWPTYHTWRRT